MSEANTYYQEWVAVELLELSNFNGKTINLLPYFLNIEIQEDLFMPVCSGNITLIDTINLYEDFPIIGEEIITIKYRDFYSESITRTFNVYGVPAKEQSNERGSMYILDFCSEELLYNRSTTYSKSYKDTLPHDIFLDAMSKVNPSKPINVQETQELQDYIVPSLYPFDVCSQMASRAISKDGQIGSYLFFEDNQKFNFVSLESLISKPAVKYRVGNANIAGVKDPMHIFKNYKYQSPVNNVKSMMSGAQGVESKTLDLLNRKLEDNSYDHFGEDYNKIGRINSSNPDLKQTSSKYKHKSNKGLCKIIVKNDENNAKSSKNKTMAIRYNVLSSYITGPKIHAELPFTASMTIGNMVDVDIPKIDMRVTSGVPENDTYVQGKYLVTAVRQIISIDHGETIVEVAKDTYTQSHDEHTEE